MSMRNIRRLSYFIICIAVLCISRLTLQKYCSSVHGVDASPFGGCDFGTGSSASSVTWMHRLMPSSSDKATRPRDTEGGGDHPPVGEMIIKEPQVMPTATGTTSEKETTLVGKLINSNVPEKRTNNSRSCVKSILFWADPTREGLKSYLSKFKSKAAFCRNLDCTAQLTISMEWEDLKTNDVVIFHHKVHKDWTELIKRRPPGQIWIFYTRESPAHTSERNNFPEGISYNVHNWTKVYLSGSDMMTIYGRFIPKDVTTLKDIDETPNWFRNKTKLCAWVASNCKYTSWDRLGFVKSLKKHMSVDMYGKCGDMDMAMDCPDDCRNTLTQYKFYLALESHTCREYITEKVWRNAFEHNVIPVVYGAPKADYEIILPPKSFIHVEDFKSFEDLAKYLSQVAEDEEEYNSYFVWKSKGAIKRETGSSIFTSPSLCEITQKVLAEHNGEVVGDSNDRNIKEWWQGSCFDVEKSMVYR